VQRVEIDPSGRISVVVGNPEASAAAASNEWDEALKAEGSAS
jgi:hypothetical protein